MNFNQISVKLTQFRFDTKKSVNELNLAIFGIIIFYI